MYMDEIQEAFMKISKEFIARHEKHEWDDFERYMVSLAPGFKDDEIFKTIGKTIYMIELCNYSLKPEKAKIRDSS